MPADINEMRQNDADGEGEETGKESANSWDLQGSKARPSLQVSLLQYALLRARNRWSG
jgi:hypothetical protein